MKNWFQNLSYKMQRWMYGRYGYDELSMFSMIFALVLALLSGVSAVFSLISFVVMTWSIVRTFSKNIEKCQAQRAKYIKFTSSIKRFFKLRKNMFIERKTHKYFKCPNCKSYLRVPKGKGKIEITCTKCKNKLIRKT